MEAPQKIDLASLRALCDAATPGPWEVDAGHRIVRACNLSPFAPTALGKVSLPWRVDAAYLAAVSPDVVRALLDRLERAEAAWLYLGDRLLGRDEVSDGELRGLCGGHHVGGPAFCDRCGEGMRD